jgi:HSP20 family protein
MLMRFDPFAEFDRLTQQLWNRGWAGTAAGPFMPIDAYRSGDHYVVHFDLPGVDPESVDLTVENNMLTVSAQRSWQPAEGSQVLFAERPQGSFTRRIQIGDGLDVDHVEATFDKGVLTIQIPVAETAKARKVEITTGSQPKELVGSAS